MRDERKQRPEGLCTLIPKRFILDRMGSYPVDAKFSNFRFNMN